MAFPYIQGLNIAFRLQLTMTMSAYLSEYIFFVISKVIKESSHCAQYQILCCITQYINWLYLLFISCIL